MTNPIPKGTAVTGNVAKHLDSRFLNSLLLAGILAESGSDTLAVTIDRVEHLDSLTYEAGTTEENVLLLYFEKSERPLKLCKTNILRITSHHGPLGDAWKGKKIKLCIEQCRRPDLGGKFGDCVRVKGKGL